MGPALQLVMNVSAEACADSGMDSGRCTADKTLIGFSDHTRLPRRPLDSPPGHMRRRDSQVHDQLDAGMIKKVGGTGRRQDAVLPACVRVRA
jgi:hypothetical protein